MRLLLSLSAVCLPPSHPPMPSLHAAPANMLAILAAFGLAALAALAHGSDGSVPVGFGAGRRARRRDTEAATSTIYVCRAHWPHSRPAAFLLNLVRVRCVAVAQSIGGGPYVLESPVVPPPVRWRRCWRIPAVVMPAAFVGALLSTRRWSCPQRRRALAGPRCGSCCRRRRSRGLPGTDRADADTRPRHRSKACCSG